MSLLTWLYGDDENAQRAAAEYLKSFVEEMNASGFVARSIERHGVQGLSAVK